eukprot:g24832.t1
MGTRSPPDYNRRQRGKSTQHVAIGFSTRESSLFVGDGEESIGFDTEGSWEILHVEDKTLYPTINFKNVTLHANFDEFEPLAPLPFACRTLHVAAREDVEILPEPEGKQEVIFPIGMPDEGTRSWDESSAFLEEFQKEKEASGPYVELSMESLKAWAHLSGVALRDLDLNATREMIESLAPFTRQSFLVKELQKYLVPSARSTLRTFDPARFKRTAVVMMGWPPEAFREKVRAKLRAEKQEKVASELRRSQASKAEAKKPENGGTEETEAQQPSQEDLEAEVTKAKDAVVISEDEERAYLERMVDEQQETLGAKKSAPKNGQKEIAKSFGNFSLPKKEEGFEEILWAWQAEEQCLEHLQRWVAEKKLMQRVDELRPNEWFREKLRDGEPLFGKFTWEDWMMLDLRVQLHLLVHGYKHAMKDPDRVTFHERHTEFYFEIFYRRALSLKNLGLSKVVELLEMVNDTMGLHPTKCVLEPQMKDDAPFENLLRLVEDARRLRWQRLDAGDELAALNLVPPSSATRGAGARPRYPEELERPGARSRARNDEGGRGYDARGGSGGGYGGAGAAYGGSDAYDGGYGYGAASRSRSDRRNEPRMDVRVERPDRGGYQDPESGVTPTRGLGGGAS